MSNGTSMIAGFYDLCVPLTTESYSRQRNRLSLTEATRERQNVVSRPETAELHCTRVTVAAYTTSSTTTTSTTNEMNDITNDISVGLPTFTLSNLESSSSEEDSSISANEDDDDGGDAKLLRTRTQIWKRRPNDDKFESASGNYTTTALGLVGKDSSVLVHRSRRRPSIRVVGYESTRDHTIDIDPSDNAHHKGNQWQTHATSECSSSRDSDIHDNAQHHLCDTAIDVDDTAAVKPPLQKPYVGLRQPKQSSFLPPSVTKSTSNKSCWNSTNQRGTCTPDTRQPCSRCIDLVDDDALVDSATSEESDHDDDDVLIVLPPPPTNPNERNEDVGAVHRISDANNELLSRVQRNRRKPSFAHLECVTKANQSEPTQDKTSPEPSSLSWLPQWNENGGTPPHTPSTRVSNHRTTTLTSTTIYAHEVSTNYRKDLRGGSGTRLGGVVVRSIPRKGKGTMARGMLNQQRTRKRRNVWPRSRRSAGRHPEQRLPLRHEKGGR